MVFAMEWKIDSTPTNNIVSYFIVTKIIIIWPENGILLSFKHTTKLVMDFHDISTCSVCVLCVASNVSERKGRNAYKFT